MADTDGAYYTKAKRAEEKLLGTKFCFGCQRQQPVETGKSFVRGKNRVWKCHTCVSKMNPLPRKTI